MKMTLSILALVLGFFSSQTFAGSISNNFQSTANVTSTCTISATNINFGTIVPTSTLSFINTTGIITATCSNGIPYSLTLGSGSGSISQRSMNGNSGNTDKLLYQVYAVINGTNYLWGDGTTGSVFPSTGTGLSQSFTAYGRLARNQFVQPDNYSDSLTVSLIY